MMIKHTYLDCRGIYLKFGSGPLTILSYGPSHKSEFANKKKKINEENSFNYVYSVTIV